MSAFYKKPLFISLIVIMVAIIVALTLRYLLNKWNMGDLANKNVQAFLKMIRYAEGTAGTDGYNTVYGGGKIANLSDHPYFTEEWTGKVLPDSYCTGAGLSPGCKSTAAGAYQITKSTWQRLKVLASLPDFSPQSQDLAAVELLRENGALPLIIAGDFAGAVGKVNRVWASLPGAGYGQPENSLASLQNIYSQNGGSLA